MAFNIMDLFGPSATNRMLQPLQNGAGVGGFTPPAGNRLIDPSGLGGATPGLIPQGNDPWAGLRQPTVDPMTVAGTGNGGAAPVMGSMGVAQPDTSAQQPKQGFWDKTKGFLGSDRMQDVFTGWMMGGNDWQKSLAYGGLMSAQGRRSRNESNQTVDWLKRKGLDEETAKQVAANPATLQDYLKRLITPKDPQSLMNAGEGRIYDPNTGQWIVAPDAGQKFREATPEEAAKYGATSGQFGPDGRFYPINPPSGTSLQYDPETGAVSFQQGSGVKPLTEGQSKDAVYATRAQGSLPLIDQHGDALTSLGQSVAGSVPVVGNYAKTPEFQQAEQAGKEFLQAILRKDTGAAITKQETDEYGTVYLPRPGDSAEVLAQKKQSRLRALEALKAGMPPQAILQQERALANSSDRSGPISQQQYDALPSGAEFVAPDGTRRRKP